MMADSKSTIFSIRRFIPEEDASPYWERYEIETVAGMTVLQGLHLIRENVDATVSWRSSCRMGVCGSCAMVINGNPALACNTQIHNVSEVQIKLAPLWNFGVIKDLVTDLSPAFEKHRRLKPYVVRPDLEQLQQSTNELRQAPDELVNYLQFSYCIKCCACIAACPTAATDSEFAGPMPLAAAHRYNADSRDGGYYERKSALTKQHGVTHCHYSGECSRVCPKGVDPARAIQLMRRELVMDLFQRARREPAQPVDATQLEGEMVDTSLRPPEFTVQRNQTRS